MVSSHGQLCLSTFNVCSFPTSSIYMTAGVWSTLTTFRWNSAVFDATPVTTYYYVVVTEDFLQDNNTWAVVPQHVNTMRANAGQLERLNNTQCIQRYIDNVVGLTDVFLVSANVTMDDHESLIPKYENTALIDYAPSALQTDWALENSWICSGYFQPYHTSITAWALPNEWCGRESLQPSASNWTYQGLRWDGDDLTTVWSRIDYCLCDGNDFAKMDQLCSLRFSPVILGVVCLLSLVKLVCISLTAIIQLRQNNPASVRDVEHQQRTPQDSSTTQSLWRRWKTSCVLNKFDLDKVPLVIFGDAIGSFLQEPDPCTKSMDFATKKDFRKWPKTKRRGEFKRPQPIRWYRAATWRRWTVTLIL